mgnify:CR=1 FL=1
MAKANQHGDAYKTKKGLTVIGNPLINEFISSSPPSNLRSRYYSYQAAMGVTGILLIFLSFRMPILFFAGAILLFIRRKWRQKTDEYAINYRHAINSLKKKKYNECIDYLNKIPYEDATIGFLSLVKASCYLELEDTESAYLLYETFFNTKPFSQWSDPIYWSAQENAVVLSLEHKNFALAEKILCSSTKSDSASNETAKWKEQYLKLLPR